MKQLFTISLVLLYLISWSNNDDSAIFQAGNTSYEQKDYKGAIDSYEKLVESNDPKVFYNLANAYYRQNEYAKAVLYYEKSSKWGGNYEDIEYNISLANEYFKDNFKAAPELLVWKYWKNASKALTANQHSILGLLLLSLGIALLLLSGKFQLSQLSIYGAIALIVIAVGFYLMAYTKHCLETNANYGIIMNSSVAVKSEPSNSSTDLFILHEGLKIGIDTKREEWYNIVLPDGKKGWIPLKAISEI